MGFVSQVVRDSESYAKNRADMLAKIERLFSAPLSRAAITLTSKR